MHNYNDFTSRPSDGSIERQSFFDQAISSDLLKQLKNLSKEEAAIIIPMIMSAGLLYACNFYITVMVGREGGDYVAAANYINRFKAFFMIAPTYFMFAMKSLLPAALKAKSEAKIDARPDLVVMAAVLHAAPLSAVSMLLLSQVSNLLHAIGEDPEHIQYVEEYYDSFIWAVPAYVGLQVFIEILPTANRANLLMALTVFRSALDIGLSSLFMFRMNMGFSSWVLANIIQMWASFLVCLAMFFSPLGKDLRKNIGFKNLSDYFNKESYSLCRKFFNLGFPIAFQYSAAVLGGVLLTLFTGKLPEKDIVAYNITGAVSYWSIVLVGSFSAATNQTTSIGNHPLKNIYTVSNLGAFLCVVLPLSLAMIFANRQLTQLYFHDDLESKDEILSLTSLLMPIYTLFSFAFALKEVAAGVFRGKQDPWTPFFMEILGAFTITVAGGAYFSFSKNKSIIGVGISEVLGTLVSMVLLNGRFWHIDFTKTPQNAPEVSYKSSGIFSWLSVEKKTANHNFTRPDPGSDTGLNSQLLTPGVH